MSTGFGSKNYGRKAKDVLAQWKKEGRVLIEPDIKGQIYIDEKSRELNIRDELTDSRTDYRTRNLSKIPVDYLDKELPDDEVIEIVEITLQKDKNQLTLF